MAFVVKERYISRHYERSVSARVVDLRYVLKWDGSADPTNLRLDDQQAYSAFVTALPSTWTGDNASTLYLDTVSVDEEDAGGGIWNGNARYVPNTIQLAVGQERRAFNSSGGTQHIVLSRQTTGSFTITGSSLTPPNYGGLIGVRSDGTPEGCDIFVPVHEFEVTRAFTDGDITQSYENALAAITYTTNASVFRGFPAKAVLFMGAGGGQRGDGIWEMTFKFAAGVDRTGVVIAGRRHHGRQRQGVGSAVGVLREKETAHRSQRDARRLADLRVH
jgi:hypothetical protein